MNSKALFFSLSFIFAVALLTNLPVQAQRTEPLWIDQFNEANNKTLLNENWFTFNDQPDKGASKIHQDYFKDPLRKDQVILFSYTLEKDKCKWNPYTALACSLSTRQLDLTGLEGFAYEFKGKSHSFMFRTSDVKDFAFYQITIPESKEWTTVMIPFTTLTQPTWGATALFDKQNSHSLAWLVQSNNNDSGMVQLDNIRMVYDIDESYVTAEQKKIRAEQLEKKRRIDHFTEDVLSNDSLQGILGSNSIRIKKYTTAIEGLQKCDQQSDSLLQKIEKSSLSGKKKRTCHQLVHLSKNNLSNDVYPYVRQLDTDYILSCNKIIDLSNLYELERQYLIQKAITDSNYNWIRDLYNYAYNPKVNYTSGAISDSAFHFEIIQYHLQKNDAVAEIGAGRAFFERALSKYCDDLTVYVNEIDSNSYEQFKTKLVFLEHLDNKNIHYIPVLGTDSTANLSGPVDKIIIKNTFHHFSAPDKMLRDFKRVLKKDGSIFITDTMKEEVVNPECKQLMTRSEMLKWLTEAGFMLVKETPMQYGKYKCLEFQLIQ
ncbi:MAG: family metalloprotease protein [Chitinophagaceae bacterium]|nr:family metalloprotease protein [Chitinophagaceae bacterium]